MAFTARKRSLGKGDVLTGVCHSFLFTGEGDWLPNMHHRSHDWGGLHPKEVCIQEGVSASRDCLYQVAIFIKGCLPPGGGLHPGGLPPGRGSVSKGVCLQEGWSDPLETHGILGDTVNKRAVRILLECILVYNNFNNKDGTKQK